MKILWTLLLAIYTTHPALVTNNYANTLHAHMWANYLSFGSQANQAEKWYKQVITPSFCGYTYKGYLHFLFQEERYKEIVQLYSQLNERFSNDTAIQKIFALSFHHAGNSKKADTLFIALSDRDHTDAEIAFYACNSYLRKKDPQSGLKVVNNYLNNTHQRQSTFIFYYLQAQIYMQLNDTVQAKKAIEKSIALHPSFEKSWLLLALLEEQSGNWQAAITNLHQVVQINPSIGKEIQHHLLQLLLHQSLLTQQQVALLRSATPFQKAIILFKQHHLAQALEQIEICIARSPGNISYHLCKIMILTEQQQFESAINYIVAQINKNPQQELWYSVLHLIPPHDKSNALLYTTLQKLCSLHPQTLWPFVLMADYHLQQQDLLSAHRYLKKAVERSTPHTALHHELSLQLARIYYTQQQFTKMEKLLENVVNSRPSFAPACNLLAYYYALHTDQLNRADQLCKQSLQEEPQNPYFLYTQSLILYKQKAFSRAFNMVEHALSLLPNEHSFLLLLAKIERKQHNNSKAQNILNTLPKTELCIHDRQIFDHLATKLSYEKK